MKRWKIGVLCAVIACLCFALTGCQSEEYTPKSKEQAVSAAALGKDGTLRVGVNASSAPLAGQTSSSSRIVGIDVDVAAYIADQMGLKLEVLDVGSDPAKALNEGTVDMVLGIDTSEDTEGFWKSGEYIQTGVALFGTASESSVPTTDSNPQIAAQASSKSSWRVTNLFGESSLVSENDLKSAFDALASGSVRYVAADAVIGAYVANSNNKDNQNSAKIIALLQDPSGYCAGVSSDNTELQAAVTGAMSKLVSGGVMNIIESKWLGSALDLNNITVVKAAGGSNEQPAEGNGGEGGEGGGEEQPAEGEGGGEQPAEGAGGGEQPAEGAGGGEQPAEGEGV